jgi:hypothetical protein
MWIVAVAALVLAVLDYFAWVATVDRPVWGTVTGLADWAFALIFLICSAVSLIRYARKRFR